MAFVVSLFVPHLSFFWCSRKAVLPDCDIFWVSSLILVNQLKPYIYIYIYITTAVFTIYTIIIKHYIVV